MRTIDATQGIRILDSRSTASLLSKVLWITTAGFLFTAVGAYLSPTLIGGFSFFLFFILTLGLSVGASAVSRRSPGLALVLFYAMTFFWGIALGPMLKAYIHAPGGTNVVLQAALTTAVGMFAMGLIAQVARFNYQRVGNYALAAVLGLIVLGVLSIFVHFISPGLYAWATLAIFSVLLLVDFMRLKDNGAGLTPVQMSLNIYFDALNIFVALLQIFGSGSGGSNRRSGNWS